MSVDGLQGQTASRSDSFDLTEALKNVTARALIVAGDEDFICLPTAARQIRLCLPNSKLLLCEEDGHFAWMEQTEVFESQVSLFREAMGVGQQQVRHQRKCNAAQRLAELLA